MIEHSAEIGAASRLSIVGFPAMFSEVAMGASDAGVDDGPLVIVAVIIGAAALLLRCLMGRGPVREAR